MFGVFCLKAKFLRHCAKSEKLPTQVLELSKWKLSFDVQSQN